MCFLELVEEEEAERLFLDSDRKPLNKKRFRIFICKFGHIKPHHIPLPSEIVFREHLPRMRLATPCWSEKQERPNRFLFAPDTRARSAKRCCNIMYRFFLSDDF